MEGGRLYLRSMSDSSPLMADHCTGSHSPYPRTSTLKVTSSGVSRSPARVRSPNSLVPGSNDLGLPGERTGEPQVVSPAASRSLAQVMATSQAAFNGCGPCAARLRGLQAGPAKTAWAAQRTKELLERSLRHLHVAVPRAGIDQRRGCLRVRLHAQPCHGSELAHGLSRLQHKLGSLLHAIAYVTLRVPLLS